MRSWRRQWGDPRLTDEFAQQTLELDATRFHVYALEWTPTQVDFFVDNQPVRRIKQAPAYAMQFMLSLYEHPGDERTTAYPQAFIVDYVRAYQPVGGY